MEVYKSERKCMDEYKKPFFEVCGRLWQCIEMFDNGRVRQSAALYGSVWKYIEVYGSLWQCMKVNRNIWKNKKLCWSLQNVMTVYESLLKRIAEYGSVQLRIEVYDIQSMEVYGTVWQCMCSSYVTYPDLTLT